MPIGTRLLCSHDVGLSYKKALEELLYISLHENKQEYDGKYPGKIEAEELGELQAGSRVGFSYEPVPAPSIAVAAEQHEHEGT